ncbi:bis(5'-nucleosyl)-tetraphosphatase (symmetrical) YqeK [Alteribacillus sp. HJP-4]|uniref:bis(5'-nucleosyl)-tetraphosphatase (symmetrical) YqeK n=1 Tax=Alteribacillus sp. HJP-4 TaxID=2775394 RepID=UPI0035CD00FA
MNRHNALAIVKKQLTEHRYIHTLGVTDTAIELAERAAVDPSKAEMAAIFHDYAKFRPKDEMIKIIHSQKWDPAFIDYGEELLHAPAGAYLVKKEAGINDEEILSAIYWHTTGKAEMTSLEKIIFLADYIEPNRRFPGVDDVRKEALESIDKAIISALRNTVIFLMKKNQPIFPETLNAYNDLVITERKERMKKRDGTSKNT